MFYFLSRMSYLKTQHVILPVIGQFDNNGRNKGWTPYNTHSSVQTSLTQQYLLRLAFYQTKEQLKKLWDKRSNQKNKTKTTIHFKRFISNFIFWFHYYMQYINMHMYFYRTYTYLKLATAWMASSMSAFRFVYNYRQTSKYRCSVPFTHQNVNRLALYIFHISLYIRATSSQLHIDLCIASRFLWWGYELITTH